jgi:hypothetical protein
MFQRWMRGADEHDAKKSSLLTHLMDVWLTACYETYIAFLCRI